VVSPYSTWLSEASLVDQVIVAPLEEIPLLATLEITGACVSGGAGVVAEAWLD
jgi:hypothetical protein